MKDIGEGLGSGVEGLVREWRLGSGQRAMWPSVLVVRRYRLEARYRKREDVRQEVV